LASFGAQIEAHADEGYTPLHCAAEYGCSNSIKALLELGAKVDAVDEKNGYHPLHWTADKGHFAAMKALLDAGSAIEARNKSGNRPLNLASSRGHLPVVELLVDRGADVHGDGCDGWSPLHREYLLSVVARKTFLITYIDAAGNNRVNVLQLLLKKGAKLAGVASNGDQPLHVAARYGFVDCVRALLGAGADKKNLQHGGKSALDYAVEYGHADVMELLF
jgi:ankyrin